MGVRDNICVIMSNAPNPEEQTTGKLMIYSLSEYKFQSIFLIN